MRSTYINPPIREAIVEFHFEPNKDWNITIPGLFHACIKEDYPVVKQQTIREVQLNDEGVNYSEGLGKTQFLSDSENRIIGIGKDVLSVHMLRPYQQENTNPSGWAEFEIRIKQALDAYEEINLSASVKRIGLRYINEIFGETNTKAPDYLKHAPTNIDGLPDVAGFMSRVEHRYDESTKLFVVRVSNEDNAEKPVFFLDIELIWEGETLGRESLISKTNELRTKKNEVFEALITDKARELFNA